MGRGIVPIPGELRVIMGTVWSKNTMGIATFPLMEGGIDGFLRFTSSLALRYVEIRNERPFALPQDMGQREIASLRERLDALSLEPIVHGAVYDVNIASLNPLIRKASIRQTVESIRFAGKLGARILVIHPGRLPKDFPAEYLRNSRINLLTSLNVMARIAGRVGVMLAIENSSKGRAHRLVASPREHLYIVNKLASSHVGALLDVGHAHTWGLDIGEYIRSLGDHLVLVHLHDNRGGADEHLALGKGTLDLKGVGAELGRLPKRVPIILCMRRSGDFEESIKYVSKIDHLKGLGRLLKRGKL